MTRLLRGAASCVVMAAATLANAHPTLVGSSPTAQQTLQTAPKELVLRFNEPVEAMFTHVELASPAGIGLQAGPAETVKDDANAVSLRLPSLVAGVYKVRWSAAGRDGHRVKGEFSFTVK
jgi:methionine-rich copper-binding protein CopC